MAAIGGVGIDILVCGINLIAPGSDIQFIGPDARIYFNGTGDQIGMILTTAVQALSLNNNFTPFNIVASELAVIELRLTQAGKVEHLGRRRVIATIILPTSQNNLAHA